VEGRSHIKVFTFDGPFTVLQIDATFFPNQAEGIVLYDRPDDSGYWIATDQGMQSNTFHVFDRHSLEHRGAFAGEVTLNTDGCVVIACFSVSAGKHP